MKLYLLYVLKNFCKKMFVSVILLTRTKFKDPVRLKILGKDLVMSFISFIYEKLDKLHLY